MEQTKTLNIGETDRIINERLAQAGIVFYKYNEKATTIKEWMKEASKEFQNRHTFSALQFFRYCLESLAQVFLGEGKELKNCSDYYMISFLTLAYSDGMKSLPIEIRTNSFFEEKVRNLFQPWELENIAENVKELICGFQAQAKECYEWMKKYQLSEKDQADSVKNYLEVLSKNKDSDKGFDDPEIKVVGEKMLDTCSLLGRHSFTQNTYVLDVLKRSGFDELIPSNGLLKNISRIFTYLDVIHYAGYMNIPTDGIKDNPNPKAISFVDTKSFL